MYLLVDFKSISNEKLINQFWLQYFKWLKHFVFQIHFFGFTPLDLLRNPNRYREIVEKLNLMCFGQRVVKDIQNAAVAMDMSSYDPQKMECCLMSYQTQCGIAYQMFDTTFAVDSWRNHFKFELWKFVNMGKIDSVLQWVIE